MLYTNLINTKAVELNDMTVGIEFLNGLNAFGKTIIEKPENMNELVKLVSMQFGKEMRIKLIDNKSNDNIQDDVNPIETMANELDIPINIIEE